MHIYSVYSGILELHWEHEWPVDQCSKLDMKYQVWCWQLYIDDIDSHWELPTQFWQKPLWASTQGGKKERNKKRTLLARSNKEQTRQKWEVWKAWLGSDFDEDQRARGAISRRSENPQSLSRSPAVFPYCARHCEVWRHRRASLHTKSPYKASGSISRLLMHNDRAHM